MSFRRCGQTNGSAARQLEEIHPVYLAISGRLRALIAHGHFGIQKKSAALALVLAVTVVGCTPLLDVSTYSLAQPYTNSVVPGQGFKHRVVFKEGAGTRLHIYLDGDGRPWETRNKRAENPTPDKALALELMALDARPALYLGRPCYFVSNDENCDNSRWWTSHRYAQDIVTSLNAVVDNYAGNYESVVLIGHSGGGTLAFLMASQRSDVSTLVTLAANLDIALWARQHRFAPLYGSLSPADVPPLDAGVRQFHFLGDQDTNISPQVVSTVASGQPDAQFRRLPELDHACCWIDVWESLLAGFDDS